MPVVTEKGDETDASHKVTVPPVAVVDKPDKGDETDASTNATMPDGALVDQGAGEDGKGGSAVIIGGGGKGPNGGDSGGLFGNNGNSGGQLPDKGKGDATTVKVVTESPAQETPTDNVKPGSGQQQGNQGGTSSAIMVNLGKIPIFTAAAIVLALIILGI